MNKQFFAGLMAFVWLSASLSLTAQNTDTTGKAGFIKDSLPSRVSNWNAPPVKRGFPYKSFLLPTTFVAYGIVSLNTHLFRDFNETVKEEVYTERQPRAMHLDNYLQYAPAVAVYGLNAAGIHGKNNFRDRTIIYGISNLIMGTTVYTVKKMAGETRPDGSDNLSFPSGHTATAFAAAEFLRQEYKDVSPWYGIAGYAAAAATGYLRISNNKHWIGDIAAGAGIGIISTKLAYWMYPAIKRSLFKNKDVHTIVMPSYQNGALGLGMVHHF
jgi:membrane-associated phospholipid phosphatase